MARGSVSISIQYIHGIRIIVYISKATHTAERFFFLGEMHNLAIL